jgi:hypothetical protein
MWQAWTGMLSFDHDLALFNRTPRHGVKPGMGIVGSRPRPIDEVHDLTAEKAIKTSPPN